MTFSAVRWLSLATALSLPATYAQAQHCWPSSLALLVRGSAGAIVDPASFDRVEFSPQPYSGADFSAGTGYIDPRNPDAGPGLMPALLWNGRGDCRIEVREVVLRDGGVEMHLWMDLTIDTQQRPAPSTWTLETPQLASGTWRLAECTVPAGRSGAWKRIPPSWVRVSGDPRERPQGSVCTPGPAR